MNKFWKIIDQFGPSNLSFLEIDKLFRSRMFILTNLISIFVYIFILYLTIFHNYEFKIDAILVFISLFSISLCLYKLIGKLEELVLFISFAFISVYAGIIWSDKSVISSYFHWIPYLCLVVSFLTNNIYSGIITIYSLLISYFLMISLKDYGVSIRNGLSESNYIDIHLVSYSSLIILIFLITTTFSFIRKKMEKRILEANQKFIEKSKNDLLSNLFGGLSHEINNPLCSIRLANDVIKLKLKKYSIDDDKIDIMINNINKSVDKATHVVHALRNLVVEEDDKKMNLVFVEQIANELSSILRTELNTKKIKFNLDNNVPKDFKLNCNKQKVIQAVIYLVNNSIFELNKTENSWINLSFELSDVVKIRITDSGRGIDPIIQALMFDPFYTTKDVNKGMGLGLTYVKSIMELHHGEISYALDDGHTSFTLEFNS